MQLDRLRYELLLLGKKMPLTPAVLMAGCAVLSTILYLMHDPIARFLSAGLEMLLPLVTGMMIASIVATDPALELQLTMPRKYHLTVIRRLTLTTLWSICLAIIASSIIFMLGLAFVPEPIPPLPPPIHFLTEQLAWFPSLVGCVTLGFGFALLLRSRSASVALLAGVWLVETIFKDVFAAIPWLQPVLLFPTTLFPDIDFHSWLLNRYQVLGIGLLLLPLGWLLLLKTERLLKGAHEA